MSINKNDDEKIPTHTDEYYEEQACQEEIYLEETEIEVVAILTSYTPPESPDDGCTLAEERETRLLDLEVESLITGGKNNPSAAPSVEEQLEDPAEELVSGDSDDAPLSEEAIEKVPRMNSNTRSM